MMGDFSVFDHLVSQFRYKAEPQGRKRRKRRGRWCVYWVQIPSKDEHSFGQIRGERVHSLRHARALLATHRHQRAKLMRYHKRDWRNAVPIETPSPWEAVATPQDIYRTAAMFARQQARQVVNDTVSEQTITI